jgi:acyl carrier protein
MNESKLKQIFADSLKIPVEKVTDDLTYSSIKEWDSIGHMALVAAIDQGFDIMMETEDVIDMSSFPRAKELLTKYGVSF